jgi:rhodanese-related sulfurtransferase
MSRGWLRRAAAVILGAITLSCGHQEDAGKIPASDRFETVRAHIHTWLSGMDPEGPILPTSDLKVIIDDWERQRTHYQIVSVRRPDDYRCAGHIPHAANIYWVDIVADENLARLDSSRILILYCSYGHGSMISATILGLLGYECSSLDFGMMNWNLDALIKEPWDRQADHEVETVAIEPSATYSTPEITGEQTDARGIILEMASRYFSGEGSPVMRPSEVATIIGDWDQQSSDYQIVDVRASEEYRKGHVPRAIYIPWREIARVENLTKIDPDRTVIVCSANGQRGQLAATALNLMGYRAVNMLFGMMDWNRSQVAGRDLWDGAAGYPVVHQKETR